MSGIFWILLLLPFALFADEASHPAFTDARQWAESRAPSVSEGVKQFNPQQVPGFTTSNPPETNYHAGNLSDSAAHMAATSEMGITLRQNYQNRPDGLVWTGSTADQKALDEFKQKTLQSTNQRRKQDEWLQKGVAIEQSDNPVQTLTGHYTDCKTTTPVAIPQYQTLTCDEFVGGEEKTCSVGQVVEVDARHTYQCNSVRQRERLSCQKILNIRIDEKSEQTPSCRPGSIIASTHGTFFSVAVHCDIGTPTLAVDFICDENKTSRTHQIRVNGSGNVDLGHCDLRNDYNTNPTYSLSCNAQERCTFVVDSDFLVQFNRPRTIETLVKTPVDVWDNQCASLEGRAR